MNVIDGHTHFAGPGKGLPPNTVGDLLSMMDRNGIDRVVTCPPYSSIGGCRTYDECNRFIAGAMKEADGRIIGFVRVNPHLGENALDSIRWAVEEEGFRGVQLDPTSDGYGVGAAIMEPVVEVAGDLEVPVYIHSGDSIFCHPEYVADFAARFEEVNFVTTFSRRASRAIRDCSNVYLMSRPFPTLAFLRGRSEGTDLDRLIFSSDSPMGSLELELRRVELADLDEGVKEKIMGGNLRRTMRI